MNLLRNYEYIDGVSVDKLVYNLTDVKGISLDENEMVCTEAGYIFFGGEKFADLFIDVETMEFTITIMNKEIYKKARHYLYSLV